MTQHTHECWSDNLEYIEYPEDLPVQDVNVYVHPSCMIMTHDYSCPVCRDNHAVISNGIMQPCWDCQKKGYMILQKNLKRKWYQFFTSKHLIDWKN